MRYCENAAIQYGRPENGTPIRGSLMASVGRLI
jgi:hypothetical protein